MMITHHRGSIGVLDIVITTGSEPEMVDLARQIRANREIEIGALEKFVIPGTGSVPESDFIREMKSHTEKVRESIGELQVTGNTGRDFPKLMSVFNEYGTDMIRTELKYGDNKELKQLAEEIRIKLQQEQVQYEKLDAGEGMGRMRKEPVDSASSWIQKTNDKSKKTKVKLRTPSS